MKVRLLKTVYHKLRRYKKDTVAEMPFFNKTCMVKVDVDGEDIVDEDYPEPTPRGDLVTVGKPKHAEPDLDPEVDPDEEVI